MLDYRFHYAQMLAEDRVRRAEQQIRHREAIRIFRLGQRRPAARQGRG